MTVKRSAILQILREANCHMRPIDVFNIARQQFPGIVLATVYNNLNALTRAGLIRRVRTADGADFFDGVLTPHEHAVCSRCGEIRDVAVADLDALFRSCTDLPVLSYDLIIHTVCEQCAAKAPTADTAERVGV